MPLGAAPLARPIATSLQGFVPIALVVLAVVAVVEPVAAGAAPAATEPNQAAAP